jgi:thiamine pyrophosphate-dependent acetolactate synthase large subunit-like protein
MEKKSRRKFIQQTASAMSLTPIAANSLLAFGPQGRPASGSPTTTTNDIRMMEGTAGALLVEQLRAAGVKYIIHSNTSGVDAIMDAVVDASDMQVIMVTHEGQAVSTAEGYALATGEMAFFIGSSNGIDNAVSNLHNAWDDGTPLIISFEDGKSLDPVSHFSAWNWECEDAETIPAIVRRAMKTAAGPPGSPVTLVFPGRLARQKIKTGIHRMDPSLQGRAVFRAPSDVVDKLARWLVEARNPLFVVGREVSRAGANKTIQDLAEKLAVPVCQSRRQDSLFCDFPTQHELFLSNYLSPMRFPENNDLFINFGARPSNRPPSPKTRVAHVSSDPGQLQMEARTHLPILADVGATIKDLSEAVDSLLTADRLETIRAHRFQEVNSFTQSMRQARQASLKGRFDQSPITWERVGYELELALDEDAVVVPELGSQEQKLLALMNFGPDNKLRIGRTEGGQLGWGVGAAFGVQLALPDRQVVALLGDGGILFGQTETLWTISRYSAPLLVVILNNHSYNETRNRNLNYGGSQYQEHKDMTSYLGSPDVDFTKIAAAYGIQGEKIANPGDLAPALQRAIRKMREGKPVVLDVEVARDGIQQESTWYPQLSIAEMR